MSSVINDTLLAIKAAFETGVNLLSGGVAVSSSNPLPVAQTDGLTVSGTVVKLTVWHTQADRENGAEPIRYDNDLRQYQTDLALQANNPVAYAYTLLEQSGQFPDANWNV